MPWRRKWPPTPVFSPGEFHGQRSLVGYGPWGCERVRHDWATERLSDWAHTHILDWGIIACPWRLRWQRICLQCERPGFDPWVGKVPWRRQWLPNPLFWPGEFQQSMRLQKVNWANLLFTFTFHCAGVLKPGGKWAYIYIFSVIARVNNLTQIFLTETTEGFLQWIINSMWVTWNSHLTLCPASCTSLFSFLSFLELVSLPFGCSHSGRGKKIY